MTDQQQSTNTGSPPATTTKILDSHELFASGQNTVLIRHEKEFYRLLKTKNGKLLLQK